MKEKIYNMDEITELSKTNEPFNITIYADDNATEREQYIAENPLCQLWYDVIDADIECGINQHPQKQMKELGYTVLDAVPESIADGWRFTVDKFIEPLPPYLREIRYDIADKKPLHCGNVFTDTLGCALSKAKRKRYMQNGDGTYTIEFDVDFADADSEKQYPGTLTYCIDSMAVFGDENTLISKGWQKVDTLQALTKDAIFQMTVDLDYIYRLREGGRNHVYDPIAYIVKLADMKDHLMQKDTLTDKLKEKYWEALPYLL